MQGTISFDGTLSGGITGGGGGGSEVTITQVLTEGTKIADYDIDGTPGELYAPDPEALPGTIVTKVLREYNDTTQTKIAKVTTLDTSNNQEVSQDLYAPSPVQCWYTPGLEQDYQIGQFTYGGVTQNVYIPYFQRPLTAGANITIDVDNVISASVSTWDYSTSEVDTGQKTDEGDTIYSKTIYLTGINFSTQQANFYKANIDLSTYLPNAKHIWVDDTNSYFSEVLYDVTYYRNWCFYESYTNGSNSEHEVALFKRGSSSNVSVKLSVKYVNQS